MGEESDVRSVVLPDTGELKPWEGFKVKVECQGNCEVCTFLNSSGIQEEG